MELKTLQKSFPVVEFQHYISDVSTGSETRFSSVLDLIFDNNVTLEMINDIGSTELFAIVTDKQTYVFTDYKLLEYFVDAENNGCIKATFVK